MSVGLTAAARTAIRTSPAPGSRTLRSTTDRTSAPPAAVMATARLIRDPLHVGDEGPRRGVAAPGRAQTVQTEVGVRAQRRPDRVARARRGQLDEREVGGRAARRVREEAAER